MSVNSPNFPTSGVWDGTTPTRDNRNVNRNPDYEDLDQVVTEIISLQKMYIKKFTNDNGSAIVIGAPVYVKSNGNIDADGSGTRFAIGLVRDESIASGEEGNAQVDGIMTATTAQWDAVTGDSGGLTPGEDYYLSDTVGELTTTAPATAGAHS